MARALERAYKQGFADAQGDPAARAPEASDKGPLDWALIPPRPRNAFWSCCLFTFGRRGDQYRSGHLEHEITERGTVGWRLVTAGFDPDKLIGASCLRSRDLGALPRTRRAVSRRPHQLLIDHTFPFCPLSVVFCPFYVVTPSRRTDCRRHVKALSSPGAGCGRRVKKPGRWPLSNVGSARRRRPARTRRRKDPLPES